MISTERELTTACLSRLTANIGALHTSPAIMAGLSSEMTRSSSAESSALSNIMVAAAAPEEDESSSSERVSASTPPTSLEDAILEDRLVSAKAGDVITEEGTAVLSERRPKRATSSRVSTYNLKKLFDAQHEAAETGVEFDTTGAGSSRNVSGLTGRTLVAGEQEQEEAAPLPFDDKVHRDGATETEMGWEASTQRRSPRQLPQRRPSVKERVKKVAGKVGSVLGKRSREVMEVGKRKMGNLKSAATATVEEEEPKQKQSKIVKELDMGTKGVLDEMDLSDDEFAAPARRPAKKVKMASGKAKTVSVFQPPPARAKEMILPAASSSKIAGGDRVKKWQKEGLYVGQDADFDPTQPGGGRNKLQKRKRPDSSSSAVTSSEVSTTAPTNTATSLKRSSFMGLPMFHYLDKTRDFTIPFDVFAPSARKGDEKPRDWVKVNRNRLVGEAKELWDKSEKLPASVCVCRPPEQGSEDSGCDDDCLNRVMQYECNDDNCNLSASLCSNRAFATLASRVKKGGAFDIGVEVIKTSSMGFGVRSCRSFAPGEIIMEYTGEIISEGECQRRMREDYKDAKCYYLMELERGLIIDGTKGSMARFINHSCEPNCEVRMVKVGGIPRMGVFAGAAGVTTGEELSYDYNFDNFGGRARQVCYCGAATCRGFLSKRLNATEQKKLLREEAVKKAKAAEEAQKAAEEQKKRAAVKGERGSSWRGWVAVDEPETKERLKREKREREERERGSERARRMERRRTGGAVDEGEGEVVKDEKRKRRKTAPAAAYAEQALGLEKEAEEGGQAEQMEDETAVPAPAPLPMQVLTKKTLHARTASSSSKLTATSGSKFTEEFSPAQRSTTFEKQTEIEVSVSMTDSGLHETAKTAEMHDDSAAGADNVDEEGMKPEKEKSGLSRVVKSVGQAVKSGLSGLSSGGQGQAKAGSEAGKGSGSGKLRQSTLTFGKAS